MRGGDPISMCTQISFFLLYKGEKSYHNHLKATENKSWSRQTLIMCDFPTFLLEYSRVKDLYFMFFLYLLGDGNQQVFSSLNNIRKSRANCDINSTFCQNFLYSQSPLYHNCSPNLTYPLQNDVHYFYRQIIYKVENIQPFQR